MGVSGTKNDHYLEYECLLNLLCQSPQTDKKFVPCSKSTNKKRRIANSQLGQFMKMRSMFLRHSTLRKKRRKIKGISLAISSMDRYWCFTLFRCAAPGWSLPDSAASTFSQFLACGTTERLISVHCTAYCKAQF